MNPYTPLWKRGARGDFPNIFIKSPLIPLCQRGIKTPETDGLRPGKVNSWLEGHKMILYRKLQFRKFDPGSVVEKGKGGNRFDRRLTFRTLSETERLFKSDQGDHVWADASRDGSGGEEGKRPLR